MTISKETALKVIDLMGEKHQREQAICEMNELGAALFQYFRQGKGSIDDVAEEIADVEIMLVQLSQMVPAEIMEAQRAAKREKLQRIIDRCIEIPKELEALERHIANADSMDLVNKLSPKKEELLQEWESYVK